MPQSTYVVALVKMAVGAFLTALLLTASGCASLQYAGVAIYTVKPFKSPSGDMVCCEVTVANGKEIGYLKTRIERRGGDWTVYLEETSVKAFEGQKVAATAATTAAAIAGGILVAPLAAPIIGAAATAGTLPAVAAGAVAGAALPESDKP